ncbi:MAG: ATP-binding protein [Actinobacteria bacterium]|nr:ATP-binding protein [Actinomycetota bacterium]
MRREPDRLLVSVWNEGPGFPPEQRGRLFRRFSRLDTPELKKRRGTGLGLYSARRIVRLHDGRMGADSQEGAWAEFWFSLPQPPGDVPAAAAPASGGAP